MYTNIKNRSNGMCPDSKYIHVIILVSKKAPTSQPHTV